MVACIGGECDDQARWRVRLDSRGHDAGRVAAPEATLQEGGRGGEAGAGGGGARGRGGTMQRKH